MRRALLTLAACGLVLTACAAHVPGSPVGAVQGASHNCADLFATAMASRGAVKGAWECLAPTVQDQFRAVGLEGDTGVSQLAAKDPVYDRQQYLGRLADGGYVYSLSSGSNASVLLLWLDGAGRVSDIQSGGRGGSH